MQSFTAKDTYLTIKTVTNKYVIVDYFFLLDILASTIVTLVLFFL